MVHVTGFSTNLGALGCLITPADTVLCDRESHASIFEGIKSTRARISTFAHNDAANAAKKIAEARQTRPEGDIFLITEGVFSMSGDVAVFGELARLKDQFPEIIIYLDDAHGLGVLGPGGRGTALHFDAAPRTDLIMGTFSKAMASIGGFIASDDEEVLRYMRYQSRTQIFSAALPAANTTAVLTCLDILEKEPERVTRLHKVTRRMREGYKEIGLRIGQSASPIIPILIGSDEKAFMFSQALFEEGVFALPAIYPAVPRGQALIRTAYMSTHEDRQMDYVLEVLDRLARKIRIRAQDVEEDEVNDAAQQLAAGSDTEGSSRAKLSYL